MAQITLSDLGIRALDENGDPVSGALCYVYDAGTTTPVTTYSDDELTTPNAFPVVANSSGTFPPVFVPGGEYKVNLTDADDASLSGFPRDNLTFGNLLDGIATAEDARAALDAQKQDDDLDDIAALTPNYGDTLFYREGAWTAQASQSGFQNRLINPLLRVDTQGNAGGVTASGSHVVEGWALWFSNGVTTQTLSRVTGDSVPYALRYAVTTGSDAAISSGEYAAIDTAIEGYNVADALWGTANAKSIWVAGRIKAPTTGVYCLGLTNAAGNRSYVFEVACTAGQWVDFEEEIPGDTSGTWNATNGIGLELRACIAAGSTFQATPDAWQAGDFFATSSQANGIASNGNTFEIENVRVSVGAPVAAEFRPMNADIAQCRRYYQRFNYRSFWSASGAGQHNSFIFPLPYEMRSTPTASVSPSTSVNVGLFTANAPNPYNWSPTLTSAAAGGVDWNGTLTYNARLI